MYLSVVQFLPYGRIENIFHEIFGIELTQGSLVNWINDAKAKALPAIEKIKELDQDDEKYLEMLNQPVLVDPTYPERLEKELGEFICHIFDQPVEQAYRRSRVYLPKRVNDRLARAVDGETLTMKNLMTRMAEKIKKKVIR